MSHDPKNMNPPQTEAKTPEPPALASAPCSAPYTIWLQWDGDQKPDYYSEHSGVTWAAHKIFSHDVEYVRADVLRNLCTTEHESKEAFIARVKACLPNVPS